MHDCGDCTLCCLLTEVPELGKKVNTLCQFCNPWDKCSIYDSRPKSCRGFRCLWLRDETMPDELRPDRCGVIFEVLTDNTFLALIDPGKPEAWKQGMVVDLIIELLKRGYAVLTSTKQMLLPAGKSPEEVMTDIRTKV